jgi:hypothetical protein
MQASSGMNICTGSNFSNKLPSLHALDVHKASPPKHFTTIAGLEQQCTIPLELEGNKSARMRVHVVSIQ